MMLGEIGVLAILSLAASDPPNGPPSAARQKERVGPGWKKHDINPSSIFEGAGAADFDGDGKLDIFSGDSFYKGPSWTRFKVRDVPPPIHPKYQEDFSDMPFDVNGDGKLDLVTCSFFGKLIGWVEHPGDAKQPWTLHVVEKPGSSEACRLIDLTGDGKPELLPNTTNEIIYYELVSKKPEVKWEKHVLGKEGAGHGVGAGDIDGDGRPEIIGPRGYFSPPAKGAPADAPWTFHDDLKVGGAGISILVFDVDGDKLNDVVWGAPHGYGFFWMKQGKAEGEKAPPASPTWTKHEIDKTLAQLHTLYYLDLDGDGTKEVLTGKRIYGHEVEPGAEDPSFIYTFKYDRKAQAWKKDVIYEGPPPPSPPPKEAKDRDAQKDFLRGTAGTGLHIEVVDIDKDGDLDLVCPGKSGLYLFESLRKRGRGRK